MAASSSVATLQRPNASPSRARSSSVPRPVPMRPTHSQLLTPAASPSSDILMTIPTARKRANSSNRSPSSPPHPKLSRRTTELETPERNPVLRTSAAPVHSKPEDAYLTPPSLNRTQRRAAIFQFDSPSPLPSIRHGKSAKASSLREEGFSRADVESSVAFPASNLARQTAERDPVTAKNEPSGVKMLEVRPLRFKARVRPERAPATPIAQSCAMHSLQAEVAQFMNEWQSMFADAGFQADWLAFQEQEQGATQHVSLDADGASDVHKSDSPPKLSEEMAKSVDEVLVDAAPSSKVEDRSVKSTNLTSPLTTLVAIALRAEARALALATDSSSTRDSPGSPPRIPLPGLPPAASHRSPSPEIDRPRSPHSAAPSIPPSLSLSLSASPAENATVSLPRPTTPTTKSRPELTQRTVKRIPPPSTRPVTTIAPSTSKAVPSVAREPIPINSSGPSLSSPSSSHSRSPYAPSSASKARIPRRETLPPISSPPPQLPFVPHSLPTDISPLGLADISSGLSDSLWPSLADLREPSSLPSLGLLSNTSAPHLHIQSSLSASDISKSKFMRVKPPLTPPATSTTQFTSPSTFSPKSDPGRSPLNPALIPLEQPRTPPPCPQSVMPSPRKSRLGRAPSLLGIRTLFRRGQSEVDVSAERKQRLESFKSMIGGPQKVSTAGLSVGLVERPPAPKRSPPVGGNENRSRLIEEL